MFFVLTHNLILTYHRD